MTKRRLILLVSAACGLGLISIGIWVVWLRPMAIIDDAPIKPKDHMPNNEGARSRPLISRENVAKIQPKMTLAEAEAILGKSGWDRSAFAVGPSHRWTVKWATIEYERKHEQKLNDAGPNSRVAWISADLMVNVLFDREKRVLDCEAIPLRHE